MTKTISEARGTLGDKALKKNKKLDPKVASVLDAAELVLKDYFIAKMLQCEFMVLGFSVKYINRFNLISYE